MFTFTVRSSEACEYECINLCLMNGERKQDVCAGLATATGLHPQTPHHSDIADGHANRRHNDVFNDIEHL